MRIAVNSFLWLYAEYADSRYLVTGVELKDATSGSSASFALDVSNEVEKRLYLPKILVRGDAPDQRLATWSEVVESAPDEPLRRQAAAAIEAALRRLSDLEILVDGGIHDGVRGEFLGVVGFEGALQASYSLRITPDVLLPGPFNPEATILQARATASYGAQFKTPWNGAALEAQLVIELAVTNGGIVRLLPHIDVPVAPHLSIDFGRIPFPSLSLANLTWTWPTMPRLVLISLPIAPRVPLELEWTIEPVLEFSRTAEGKLRIMTQRPGVGSIVVRDSNNVPVPILTMTDVGCTASGSLFEVAARFHVAAKATLNRIDDTVLRDDLTGPFIVRLADVVPTVEVTLPPHGAPKISVLMEIGRLEVRARSDPSIVLALTASVTISCEDGEAKTTLSHVELIDPYPFKLGLAAANIISDGARSIWSLLTAIPVPNAPGRPPVPDAPNMAAFVAVLERLSALATAAARWLAEQGLGALHGIAGLAESVVKMFGDLLLEIAARVSALGSDLAKHIVVEVRIDVGTGRIAQVVVAPLGGTSSERRKLKFLGLALELPFDMSPALVCDIEHNWFALALQPRVPETQLTLSTDLWLTRPDAKITEPVSGADATEASPPLISLECKLLRKVGGGEATAPALIAVSGGKAVFFRKIETALTSISGPQLPPALKLGEQVVVSRLFSRLEPLDDADFAIKCTLDESRYLSLFRSPDGSASSTFPDNLGQYIKISSLEATELKPPRISLALKATIKFADTTLNTNIGVDIDLETLSATFKANRILIDEPDLKKLRGLDASIVYANNDIKEPPFFLDFSDGDARLGLDSSKARIELAYRKLSNSGKGLVFSVDEFLVSRDGLDLSAAVKKDNPAVLAGIEMPFRFDEGRLAFKRGRIQSFAIAGHGNLPPALVGEAKASIRLAFAERSDGELAVQACEAVLDKSADPLRCEATRFSITVSKLGLKFVEDGGYHFYFTLTGSAEFRPNGDEFKGGLLAKLPELKIVLDEAPLASDPRVLLKHIEFQVPVYPPKRSRFFELFSFELRGVGFHPASPAFNGNPAFSISGQVNFTEFSDIVTPKFDFHKLWVAPPSDKHALPRVRFDGLGIGLALGSMAEVSGTAIAVDESLPSMLPPDTLPKNVVAKGFLGSGSLKVKGWASMSAAMGFLELWDKDNPGSDPRHSFFLYVKQRELSEPIPTPVGTIYLREVGYGFGYRYTLAGLAAADTAETPKQLVKLLDDVSKYQGNLDDLKAWRPTYNDNNLTLAMSALFSMTSASTRTSYNHDGEKDLPNFVLFDVVAALRSDLTFLMNVRSWIAYNYADWNSERGAAWQSNPTLTGYMYLSAPRQEFLSRTLYNPGAEVGQHPKLPPQLKDAMKRVRWSSTLYVRPGLFHMELGWPYELGFEVGDPGGNFHLSIEGGTVLRIEDSAMLYGIALRGRGHIRFYADTGGDFGASVSAGAQFAVGAKLMAYLSTRHGETMLYGSLSLDLTIEFSVRVWLRTRWFELSGGFSVGITIHIGVELVIEPAGVGGHVEATVVIRAFGRSLCIGIGFNFGGGRLAEARQRVDRYMALGLGATYPDPERGVPAQPAPLPEPSRRQTSEDADRRIEERAERRENTAPPSDEKLSTTGPIVGLGFGGVDYWAILFPIPPIPGEQDCFLVQLVPRGSEFLERGKLIAHSYFYAAPEPTGTASYKFSAELDRFLLRTADAGPPTPGMTDFKGSKVGLGANAPTLEEFFSTICFLDGGKAKSPGDPVERGYEYVLTDTYPIEWGDPTDLPSDPQKSMQALADAARSRADLGARRKRMQAVEEARSSFIATVGECASRLAELVTKAPGKTYFTAPASLPGIEFDVRAIGLTFVMTQAEIETRIKRGGIAGSIETLIPIKDHPEHRPGTVVVFNPPRSMFRVNPPRLNDAKGHILPTGIALSWKLDSMWLGDRPKDEVQYQPEYHVKHYRVERTITGLARQVPPRLIIATASETQEELRGDPAVRRLNTQRSPTQVVDDLKDLDDISRARILGLALERDETANAVRNADVQHPSDDKIVVSYTILPVDCAGTSKTPLPITVRVPARPKKAPGVDRAIARFAYRKISTVGAPAVVPSLAFLIEEQPELTSDGYPVLVEGKLKLRGVPRYRLRVRTERGVAVGLFGQDALSEARSEPPVPECNSDTQANEIEVELTSRGGDHEIKIQRVPRPMAPKGSSEMVTEAAKTSPDSYWISKDDWKKLIEALDVSPEPTLRAARFYVRPDPSTQPGSLRPDWCPVQLQLRMTEDGVSEGQWPVDVTVERFEHPIDARFNALETQNLWTTSGRLHLYYPKECATFGTFVENPQETTTLMRDGDRRTGVRLGWNASPTPLEAQGTKGDALQALIGGYDLFALDVSSVPKDGDPLRFVKPIDRVQRLPTRERGQEPSETGDFARVNAYYPSETLRLTHPDRGTKRRATWHSPADSFLAWPQWVLRRSLVTVPDENDIAALFDKGVPDELVFELDGWPNDLSAAPPPVPTSLANENPGKTAGVRSILRHLVLPGVAPESDDAARKHPSRFANVKLKVTAKKKGQETGECEIPLDLVPPIHPVLADIIDHLRYTDVDDESYRRYEPVLEAPPPLNAEKLAGFLNETSPDRDPAGWGALRTLGLAVAFRLFDTERGQFATPADILKKVNRALRAVLPRYRTCLNLGGSAPFVGVPFVDVMFTADQLSKLVSFDGTAPANDANTQANMDEALALVQIELRPAVERLAAWTANAADARDDHSGRKLGACNANVRPIPIVRYATVRVKDDLKHVFDEPETVTLTPKLDDVIVEVQMEQARDVTGQRRALLSKNWAMFPRKDGEPLSPAIKLEASKAGETLAYLRIVSFTKADENIFGENPSTVLGVDRSETVEMHYDDNPLKGRNAWGQFGDLPPSWLSALTFGYGFTLEGPDKPEKIRQKSSARATLEALQSRLNFLKHDFVKDDVSADAARELASQLAQWAQRFMDHGPARALAPDEAGLALAMLTRPNPWRLAPDVDGRLSVLLLEKDRWGKTRKYAVRPFGRYESLVAAVKAANPTGREAWELIVKPNLTNALGSDTEAERLQRHFIDAVIERTEPLAAPVVVATRRTDPKSLDGLPQPTGDVELILWRHPEDSLSDANVPVADGVAMRHVAIGFWREFIAPAWPAAIGAKDVDVLASFGPFVRGSAVLPKPAEHNGKKDDAALVEDLREIYARTPDLWRGAHVLRVADMPYGFRIAAAAYAAAGAIVSDPSVVRLDEPGYGLKWPWSSKAGKDEYWQEKQLSERPAWSFETGDGKGPIKVKASWPGVRILDGLLEVTNNVWLAGAPAPSLYRLPDPAVSYRLSIDSDDGRVRSGEVDFSPVFDETTARPQKPVDPTAAYLSQIVGPHFKSGRIEGIAESATHFELAASLDVEGDAKATELPEFDPRPDAPTTRPTRVTLVARQISAWSAVAPLAVRGTGETLELVIKPPAAPYLDTNGRPHGDWDLYRAAMLSFQRELVDYSDAQWNVNARVRATAAAVLNKISRYVDISHTKPWPHETPGGRVPAHLDVPWRLGMFLPPGGPAQLTFDPANIMFGWRWPKATELENSDITADKRRAICEHVKDDGPALLQKALYEALCRQVIARRRQKDEAPFAGLKTVSAPWPRYADPPDPGTTIDPQGPFDFLVSLPIGKDPNRAVKHVDGVFEKIESVANAADTLAALLALRLRDPKSMTAAFNVPVRWSAWPEVEAAFSQVANMGPVGSVAPQALLLKRPAHWDESVQLPTELRDLVAALTKEILFGPRRRLVLQAFHGLAKPIEQEIGPKADVDGSAIQ